MPGERVADVDGAAAPAPVVPAVPAATMMACTLAFDVEAPPHLGSRQETLAPSPASMIEARPCSSAGGHGVGVGGGVQGREGSGGGGAGAGDGDSSGGGGGVPTEDGRRKSSSSSSSCPTAGAATAVQAAPSDPLSPRREAARDAFEALSLATWVCASALDIALAVVLLSHGECKRTVRCGFVVGICNAHTAPKECFGPGPPCTPPPHTPTHTTP